MLFLGDIIKDKGLFVLALCFAVVSAADVSTTVFAIQNGATEMNPLIRGVVNSPIILIAIKGIAILSIMYVVDSMMKRYSTVYPNIGYFSLSLVNGITLGAVINNLLVLKNMGFI